MGLMGRNLSQKQPGKQVPLEIIIEVTTSEGFLFQDNQKPFSTGWCYSLHILLQIWTSSCCSHRFSYIE